MDPTKMIETLTSLGLPGIAIVVLAFTVKALYNKNMELHNTLVEIIKNTTQAITEATNAVENHNQVLSEMKSIILTNILKEKKDD